MAWAALPHHRQLRGVLARELSRLASGLRALTTRDPPADQYARQQFDVPSATDLANAEGYLAMHPAESAESAPSVTADIVRATVRTVLVGAVLADWAVEGHERMAARMSVIGSRRLVRVRRDAVFWPAEVHRLMVHEIGTHLPLSANGHRQRLQIPAYGTTGYVATEEGLAIWHEQQSGVAGIKVMRRDALRVIASHTALTGDFCVVRVLEQVRRGRAPEPVHRSNPLTWAAEGLITPAASEDGLEACPLPDVCSPQCLASARFGRHPDC